MIDKIKKYINDPNLIYLKLNRHGLLRFVPDKKHLQKLYKIKFGKKLDLENPKTFNEKLQWLKLYDRKDIYTTMVDKYEAKKYVANIIGEEYIIPTIGVYNSFKEIDFDKLPNQFVIKCTHDSGGLEIVRDKNNIDKDKIEKKINKCLKRNYYIQSREWPYKNVKPRIIIEKYMFNNNEDELKDYKVFNFNGYPKIILVCSNRSKELKKTWFDINFKRLDITENNHKIDETIKKPNQLSDIIKLSEKLSANNPFIRTDFYVVNNKIYFGEMTFYPSSGFEKFNPQTWDRKLGEYIDLSNVKKDIARTK